MSIVRLEAVRIEAASDAAQGIPMQPASADIWDKKYRLKTKKGDPVDVTIDDTYKRVARALSGAEQTVEKQAYWYERFLWALRRGAIPAGRITSNAGALEHKPSTSTINCTVSGTITDSMDGILDKVHEAGLTLKAGCGIGYEFSTLRPRGAYVSGAGAYTSGPLSFMDIYDKMCFTVSSAGGRRGAQMGTFDVSHPDVKEFIGAKREDGRLRQFNLSLLITDEFMAAVENDRDWALVFPVNLKEKDEIDLADPSQVVWREWPHTDIYVTREDGLVACKIYGHIRARQLWNRIMASTYDFAEPGFILIDRVNEMNNNWWCENIRATNPCVTADTRLATQFGMVRIGELHAGGHALEVTADRRALGLDGRGVETRPAVPAFLTAEQARVYRVVSEDGYEIKATEWHDFYTDRGKLKLRELTVGDRLWVQSGKGQFGSEGSEELGELLGLITGDGHFTERGAHGEDAAVINLWGEERQLAERVTGVVSRLIAETPAAASSHRDYAVSAVAVAERNLVSIRSVQLARALAPYNFSRDSKLSVPEVVWRGSEACVKGYLRGLFQTDGTVNISSRSQSCSVRLASSEESLLKDVQALLANFGVFSRIRARRPAGERLLPDGHGGKRAYACRADFELIVDGQSREQFMRDIGFLLPAKNDKYQAWVTDKKLIKTQRFSTRIARIEYVGEEAVYDTTQADHNTVIFNGLVTGQCGEQPLPPYGACLLGSINLTNFVRDPFTDKAAFDFEEYKEVVRVFTRMLDNVVEVNGLPLEQQRNEITRKRRHGMGFLGLGSTVTMLRMKYGSPESCEFTEAVSRDMAVAGWEVALALSEEKGPAPIMDEDFTVTAEMLRKRPEMAQDGWSLGQTIKGRLLHAKYSRYMQRVATVAPALVTELSEKGARFTHHSSIAPTGTISLSLANNASNGIEPSFAHHYSRNVIREGKKSKEKVDVFCFELLAYRTLVNAGRHATLVRRGQPPAGLLHLGRRHHAQGARGYPGRLAEVDRLVDLQDRERAHGPPLRGVQGHLHVRPQAGPEGLHHLPLQPGRLPGRAGEGNRPGEHHLPLRARGRHGGRGPGQRGNRVRRRAALRRQPVRCFERGLLRKILSRNLRLAARGVFI